MRYLAKHYWKIPFGEIQYGRKSGRIAVWFAGRLFVIRKGTW